MTKRRLLQNIWKSSRDFLCALGVFAVLFAAMTTDREIADPISLFLLAFSNIGADLAAGGSVAGLDPGEFAIPSLLATDDTLSAGPIGVAFATTLAAVLFSVIVAFKLAFFRHLRRVHASSRRGAWRGAQDLRSSGVVSSPSTLI
ncbi:MAG: hypothetical protein ACR2OV_09410 [Hyphomicrobiaceae bacterium]